MNFDAKVIQTNGKPIIFLPDRKKNPRLPFGPAVVSIDGKAHELNFAKIAVNAVRVPGDRANVLPSILRGWFGPSAGLPGTHHRVGFALADGVWALFPIVDTNATRQSA